MSSKSGKLIEAYRPLVLFLDRRRPPPDRRMSSCLRMRTWRVSVLFVSSIRCSFRGCFYSNSRSVLLGVHAVWRHTH